ncbi:MAG: Uma2 family endonuclease [Pirellula sp.]|jgi:Uma2 family endonuclease|nr:Uma2 family endonuclease [Pirellula sp.]
MNKDERIERPSVEEYLAGEEDARAKSEYVDGSIRSVAGASNRHNSIKLNCLIWLGMELRDKPCWPFDSDTKVRICRDGMERFYYPDAQVVCEFNDPLMVYQDHPVLIIEVLSSTTRHIDLDEKMTAYLTIPSLQCYITLEQDQPIATVMRRTQEGFLREVVEGITSTIDLPSLDCSLPMTEIYRGIKFKDRDIV